MKARSVARELALLILFQLDRHPDQSITIEKASLEEAVVASVRTLCELAQEQLETAYQTLSELGTAVIQAEIDHPNNAAIPLDIPTRTVPLPDTQAMTARIDAAKLAIEQLDAAFELPEVLALSKREDVLNYVRMLVRAVKANEAQLNADINAASQEWRVERIQKMDLLLLQLALGEIRESEGVNPATVVDETLELAKRYTPEESRAFIHGVLGGVLNPTAPAAVAQEQLPHV